MKKFFALLVFILALASCEKEVKFRGEQTDSKLVLYCNAAAGDSLVANVSVSIFFLDRVSGDSFISGLDSLKGSVKVYVNGSVTPYIMRYSPREPVYMIYDPDNPEHNVAFPPETIRYSCDYIPKEGDHIKVVASFPGFDEVSGETTVPHNNMKMLDCNVTKMNDFYRYDITACVEDPGTGPLYYAVYPSIKESGVDFDYSFEYALGFTSSDIVFADATDQLISFIEGEDSSPQYFSNDLVYGKRHEFKLSFMIPYYYVEGYPVYNDEDYVYIYEYTLTLGLHTFDESYYYHRSSLEKLNSEFGLFSEGVTLYSNVKGGYGTVCSSATNSVTLPLHLQ